MEVEMLLERGELLLEQGRFNDAERFIRQALEKDPNNGSALAAMARCYLNNNKIDQGIEMAHQAIAVEPNNDFYFYLLGFGYLRKDELIIAKTQLHKAIELDPYHAEYFGMLALVYLESKDFEKALEMANEGLALEADNITCLNARSSALNKLKRIDEAFQTMDDALAQDPDNEFTHNVIGWNLLERGDHRQALVHFREALRIAPDNENAKAGMKEALKSRILPYKWLLQYSFWVHNKGKRFQSILPIALYVVFRILISASNSTDNSGLTWLLVSTYILLVVTSWTIESIANFILLYHPVGRYALTTTEKWSAINVVAALGTGLAMMGLSHFTDLGAGTDYGEMLFFAGMVSLSLALPLSNTSYPVRFKREWRTLYGLSLIVMGLVSLLVFAIIPGAAMGLFICYGIAFLAYNWIGLIAR